MNTASGPDELDFIQFALDHGVLRFGEFTLKSGRVSPYFFNSGLFDTGAKLSGLARFYAGAIQAAPGHFDLLFGPAYKGIPLVSAVSVALYDHYQVDIPYAFNRKEAKDHGEGGRMVGAPVQGRVLIVDDVISAGTSVRESVEMIREAGGEPAGVAIALDREERGTGPTSAVQEVVGEFGLELIRVARLETLVRYLQTDARASEALRGYLPEMQAYRESYGVA